MKRGPLSKRSGNKLVQPFLKWAGGKRYLLSDIRTRMPDYNSYHEPFLGGGALLFDIQPKKAFVNDINSEIINVYEVVKNNVTKLINHLKLHKNNQTYFYRIRDLDRKKSEYQKLNDIEKASRLIYLNKTCFNGLFRVNSQGQFNAPFGRYKNPNFINEDVLLSVSKFLKKNDISFSSKSFEKTLSKIKKGDFVYLDPPYDPVSNTASFTGYSLDGFTKEDQLKLRNLCDKLHKKGAKFLLSNSATEYIKDIYQDYKIDIVKVPRAINSNGAKRGKVDEVLVRNYEV